MATLASQLADWATGLRYDDLPDPVVAAAKESIRDTLAGAVLGARGRQFGSMVAGDARTAVATSIGSARPTGLIAAATANAIAAHGCELDDTLLGAGGHPGAVVVPVALATAEAAAGSGRDLITAVVAGYELLYRVMAPIYPSNQPRGFQATGVAGPFAAAATAASIRGHGPETLTQAFGIAGSYAAGLLEYDQTGGECKRLYAGLAARAGLEAVELASAGITGPATILEGRRGVFAGFGDQRETGRATDGLGQDFSILTRRRVKRYPAVGSFHGALDALGTVLGERGETDPASVAAVDVFLAPLSVAHGGAVVAPTDVVSAQFSCAYSVALRVLFGRNDLELYEDRRLWTDPAVLAVAARVTVQADDRLDPQAEQGRGRISVHFTDGTVREANAPVPAGRPDNPLPRDEMDARFTRFSRGLGESAQRQLDHALTHLEHLDGVGDLAGPLRTPLRPARTERN
jgi:2-methylcitrate dehydratase PrpD